VVLLFLQGFQKKSNTATVKVKKLVDPPVRILHGMMVCREGHNRIEQRFVSGCLCRQDGTEEVVHVTRCTVVIVGDVIVEVVQIELHFVCEERPVGS